MGEHPGKDASDGLIKNMPSLAHEITVAEYVQAAAAASSRVRTVMIVLVVASVLLAIELRNTSYSWIDARLEIRTAALKLFDQSFDPDKSDLLEAIDPDGEQTPDDREQSRLRQRDLYRRARLFLQSKNLNPKSTDDKKLLEKDLDDYRKAAIEQVALFHIPFFSAVFDHNDIGMFGGFTFFVVLLWLRFTLARELSNLTLVLNRPIPDEDLRRCHELLAMQQVLTVPSTPGSPTQRRWRWIPRSLYLIPALVYLFQMYFDFTTVSVPGAIYGKGKMWLLVISSSMCFILILIFTLWSLVIANAVDKTWDNSARRLYPDLFTGESTKAASGQPNVPGSTSTQLGREGATL